MNKTVFPWIASAIGLVFLAALSFAGATSASGEYALPLLTLLFMSELGVLVTAAGAFVGLQLWSRQRHRLAFLFPALACAALAIALLVIGLALWSTTQAG